MRYSDSARWTLLGLMFSLSACLVLPNEVTPEPPTPLPQAADAALDTAIDGLPPTPPVDGPSPTPAQDAAPDDGPLGDGPPGDGPPGDGSPGDGSPGDGPPDEGPPDEGTPPPDQGPEVGPMDASPPDDCVVGLEVCDGLDNDCDDIVDESDDEAGACRCIQAPIEPVDLCHVEVDWPTALAACQARGGSLAVIHERQAMAHLNDAFRLHEGAFGGPEFRAWIGLNDRASEGQFVWANGEESPFRDWHDSEPNDREGEDCVNIVMRNMRLAWNDKRCQQLHAFICGRE